MHIEKRVIVKCYLDDMLLHTLGIAASQNAQQLVVRDEEESREGITFAVQVVIERLLTLLQSSRQVL